MKQQLEQLLKDAEEITAKMREALAQMDKPALAAKYNEVVDAVKPEWLCTIDGDVMQTNAYQYNLPTEAAAKQDAAFRQIKNLEAYCAAKFEGERDYTVFANCDMDLKYEEVDYAPFHFTRKAAEWLIANHPEPFLVFFGVKS